MLYITYLDRLLGDYDAELRRRHATRRPAIAIRNKLAERNWRRRGEISRFRAPAVRLARIPILLETWGLEYEKDT